MITNIFGEPGVGKTAFMTYLAMEAMANPAIRLKDLRNCRRFVDKLNVGGYKFTVPPNHLVYADYAIEARKFPLITNYLINPHDIGLPNKERKTHFIPPHAHIFLDEAQGSLNSRAGGIEEFVSRYYEYHRHWRLDIVIASQRIKLIDLNVRGLAGRAIEPLKVETIENKYGFVTKTVWTCLEFDNSYLVEQYLNSGKNPKFGKKVKFTYNGDIFKHYDTEGCWPAFLDGMEDMDFDRTPAIKPKFTVDYVKKYNEMHPALKPVPPKPAANTQ